MLTVSTDIFFFIGIALLPFENMFFAPSAGWGAITPLVFCIYVFFNFRFLNRVIYKYRKMLFMFFWLILISFFNFALMENYLSEMVSRFISAFISLGLGIINLVAFDIYFIEKKGNVRKVEHVLLVVYSISLVIGFLQFLAVHANINMIRSLDLFLSKRSYLPYNRIQYTFTEPSFIGMHLFGVLLPFYLYGQNKKLRNLFFVFAISSVVFSSGVRILVDILVIATIFMIHRINFRKAKNIVILLFLATVLIGGSTYVYNTNARVKQIMDFGIYADGSLSSRYFRINASVIGYKKNIGHILFGYGLGQEVYPLLAGYKEAAVRYQSSYIKEINELRDAIQRSEESVSYCLFIRIVSEGGLVVLIFVLIYFIRLYKHEKDINWKSLIVSVLYIYIQFESYAFYSIWLIIILCKLREVEKNDSNSIRLAI